VYAVLGDSTRATENLLQAHAALERALYVLEQLQEATVAGEPPNRTGWQLVLGEATKRAAVAVVFTTLFCAQADVDLEAEIEQVLQSLEVGN
jgi:hypothetical protein